MLFEKKRKILKIVFTINIHSLVAKSNQHEHSVRAHRSSSFVTFLSYATRIFNNNEYIRNRLAINRLTISTRGHSP